MRRYRPALLTPFGQVVMTAAAFTILAGITLLHLIERMPVQ